MSTDYAASLSYYRLYCEWSGFNNRHLLLHSSGGQTSYVGLTGLNSSKVRTGFFLEALCRICFFDFSSFFWTHTVLGSLLPPSKPLWAGWVWLTLHHSDIESFPTSLFHFQGPLLLHWAHGANVEKSSCFKFSWLATLILLCHVTYSQFWELNCGLFCGPHSAYHMLVYWPSQAHS